MVDRVGKAVSEANGGLHLVGNWETPTRNYCENPWMTTTSCCSSCRVLDRAIWEEAWWFVLIKGSSVLFAALQEKMEMENEREWSAFFLSWWLCAPPVRGLTLFHALPRKSSWRLLCEKVGKGRRNRTKPKALQYGQSLCVPNDLPASCFPHLTARKARRRQVIRNKTLA